MFGSIIASKRSLFRPSRSTPAVALAATLALGSLLAATDAVAQYDGGFRSGAPRDGGFRSRFRGGPGGRFPDGEFRRSGFTASRGFAMRRAPAFRGGPPDDDDPRAFAVRRSLAFRGGPPDEDPRFAVRRGPAFRGGAPDDDPRPFAVRVYRDGRYQYYYYGCDRWRWAATPWGWRLRRVNICYPSTYDD
jgi:hypothetical protein